MLETQISPIIGLTFVGLLELVVFATILSGIGAVIGIILSAISLRKFALNNEKQAKISSASLVLELLLPWRKQPFQDLINKITDPKINEYDEKDVEMFLNQLEDIAIFYNDKTITENHVKEFFGANIKMIREDEFIKNYMKKWVDKNPDYYFTNLTRLVKKSDQWDI